MEARRRVKGVSLNNQVSDNNNSSRFCQCFHVVFMYFSLLCYGVLWGIMVLWCDLRSLSVIDFRPVPAPGSISK